MLWLVLVKRGPGHEAALAAREGMSKPPTMGSNDGERWKVLHCWAGSPGRGWSDGLWPWATPSWLLVAKKQLLQLACLPCDLEWFAGTPFQDW